MSNLQGKNILITRDQQGATILADVLRKTGANPIEVPLLQINCKRFEMKDALTQYSWVFFTSQKGVACFLQHERYAQQLHQCNIAAVGEKTKAALHNRGYVVDFMPSTYNAETMASQFLQRFNTKERVLFVRGNLSRPVLLKAFTKEKIPYDVVEVYETKQNDGMKQTLQKVSERNAIDYITFTSPSAIDAFLSMVPNFTTWQSIPTVCIGTTTEKKAIDAQFSNILVADVFTIEGMVEKMIQHHNGKDE
ncbi:uroporphyrinogen-III synthase [Pseudogracilibacillus sp. ICA-222130]|uniref:uroporphyrinogen-III synthase n=1 Tax=Pseudogracilibacillus sp. ICA-222130 TaxID=3134655 RepID=UPI0030C425C3